MVDTQLVWDQKATAAWQKFVVQEGLSTKQADQFRQYADALLAWNAKSNLTRIVDIPDILAYHFQDSLRVNQFAPLQSGQTVCDIGSGGGFPGIPLAIKRPDLNLVLLEVNQKKVAFLQHVIELLHLERVTVMACDWRTFLRQALQPVAWFLTRASLPMEELMRMFKPGCAYRNATLIYWASDQWQTSEYERPFFIRKEAYTVGSARRWYIFFGSHAL